VVGINTAIASRSGGYQGIGFSIPSNTAKWVVGQLINGGKVQRAYLGVSIGEPSASVARKLGLRPGQGVLVSEVFPGSPAETAGFKAGDLIVSFAGQPTSESWRLQSIVERCPMGSTQKAEVIRDGRKLALSVVVQPLPDDLGRVSRGRMGQDPGEIESFGNEVLGVKVSNLTAEIAQRLGYEGTDGVLITEIDPNGIAARAGLRAGAIILQVDRQSIKNVDQFEAAMKSASLKEGILLLVRIGRSQRYIVLQTS
jgi:serine protease Do